MHFELKIEGRRLQVAGRLDPSVTRAIEVALRDQPLPVDLDLSRTAIESHVALVGLAQILRQTPFVGLVRVVGITQQQEVLLRYLGVVKMVGREEANFNQSER